MVKLRKRRLTVILGALAALIGFVIYNPASYEEESIAVKTTDNTSSQISAETDADTISPKATDVLAKITIKGRAPKTGYEREKFYSGWPEIDGCSLRQIILKRELGDTAKLSDNKCTVLSGNFTEPYTGQHLTFNQKTEISKGLQIDHVVALSDAWQKGAQNLSPDERFAIATDPLNLLAVDASTNQGKSDGDAATWLPPNKSFRCQYVARQISVKYKYNLWITAAEKSAMSSVLASCPNEVAIGVKL